MGKDRNGKGKIKGDESRLKGELTIYTGFKNNNDAKYQHGIQSGGMKRERPSRTLPLGGTADLERGL